MVLKPPGEISSENALSEGDLVMYEQDGQPIIGSIIALKGHKQLVLNERGLELELDAKRLHRLPGKMPGNCATKRAKEEKLSVIRAEIDDLRSQINLEKLRANLGQDERPYSPTELCESLFGKNSLSEHAALRIALIRDKVFFKRDRDYFIPRPAQAIAEQRRLEEQRLQREKRRERLIQQMKARLKGGSEPFADEFNDILNSLLEAASGKSNIEPGRFRDLRDVLNDAIESLNIELHGSPEQKAYGLLLKLKHITPETNLAFFRHGPVPEFSKEALEEAEKLSLPDSIEAYTALGRMDLSELDIRTVDDASTKDMDDGLSVEEIQGGYRVGVHISDVSFVIKKDSALDADIKLRASSIYAPERTLNMLPDFMAEGLCSLVEGKLRPAMSMFFEVDKSFSIKNRSAHLSVIKVKQRLSYEEADKLIEGGDPFFSVLFQVAATLEAERFMAGGTKIHKKDILVKPGNGDLLLTEIDEAAPGRSLIGEMMVMANSFLADAAKAKNIPIFFRSQAASAAEDDETGPADGPAFHYRQRSKLKRSNVSLDPAPHATLGLQCYTQSTSPIRRYLDLCNQRQFAAALMQETPPYSRAALIKIQDEAEGPLNACLAIAKESKRFWILHWLKRRARNNSVIRAVVLRTDLKNPLVELDEVHIPALARVKGPKKPGDEIRVKIAAVNPHDDYIKLEEL